MSARHDHDKFESDYVLERYYNTTEQLFYQRLISSVASTLSTSAVKSNDRHSKHTPEHIAKVFDITIDKARAVQDDTTNDKNGRESNHTLLSNI
jgi:hypothetical protein